MRRSLASVALAFVLTSGPAYACRYNVRDVGFVDFEAEAYHLYAYAGPATPVAELDRIREAARTALRDANVVFELVPSDVPSTHPAFPYRTTVASATLPAAVLVAPDTTTLPVPLCDAGGRLIEDLSGTLGRLVESPTRDALLASVTRAFGTILLLEGTDATAHQNARRIVAEAIQQIRGHMKSLPKNIDEPPALEVLDVASFARESVLLHTLRQDTQPTPHPRAAVFYGRGRWIGPIMKGDEISTRNLVGLFSIVGADCECGFDLGWTLGTRLPLRWAESRHAPLAKALGFDPENPLIKMEIGTLVNRRGTLRPEPASRNAAGSPSSAVPSAASTAPPVAAATPSPEALAELRVPPRSPAAESPKPPRGLATVLGWWTISAVGLLVLGVAVAQLVRARRQGRLD